MLVIADSSPLIVLVNVGYIDILPKLFGQIVIPPAVASELAASSKPQAVRDLAAKPPSWLAVQKPASVQQIPKLHLGECEALSLALELHADVLLIDERRAYREAVTRKLNAIGTVRVLEQAATDELLDLKDAFDRLKQTDFWISHKLLDERLNIFRNTRRPNP